MAWLDKFKGRKKDGQADSQATTSAETIAEPEAAVEDDKAGLIPADVEEKSKRSWLDKIKAGLSKTRKNLTDKIEGLVRRTGDIDDDFWEELEDILIQADVGVKTTLGLIKNIRSQVKKEGIKEATEVIALLRSEVEKMLAENEAETVLTAKPHIILVVGVNGAGKTTSIAKMAYKYKNEKQKVLLAAADTYRAAAIDQLQTWADRAGVELIKHQEGSDPGAVVFDAIAAAKARKSDILIIDTAGRLQNKTNLMKEISKVKKIIEREMPENESEVLLVLDAATGQNAISQARLFQEATGISGIILTKLDGTAKGGIVLAIADELKLPVKYVGVGETMDDLREFSAAVFAEALFGE
ncbi:MAG: signal recognition particle-docking protein FtsY [Syntrophomonadaceae bacterium]|nr:signal recognition particle-docking protein FtsY [Syntrophomonadaceae bacterium]